MPRRRRIGEVLSSIVYQRMAIGFPWYWPARRSETLEMRTIRKSARRLIAQDRHPLVRLLVRAAAALAWPIGAAVHLRLVMKNTRDFSSGDFRRHALDAYWVALRHNVWPSEYFSFELWKPKNRADVDNYFYHHEIPRVLASLTSRPEAFDPIDDKIEFSRFCGSHGLPCQPILSIVRPGISRMMVEAFGYNELWTKPARGYGSLGGEPWLKEGDSFVGVDGRRLTCEQFLKHIADCATRFGPMLVEPRARNHPVLRGLTNGYAAVFRLITCSDWGRGVFMVGAYAELPNGATYTSQGAPIASIEVEGGRLKQARKPHVRLAALNSEEADLKIPGWRDACQAVLSGHAMLPREVLIGWDVAITPSGPVLLEANRNITTNEIQFCTGEAVFVESGVDKTLADRIIKAVPKGPTGDRAIQ